MTLLVMQSFSEEVVLLTFNYDVTMNAETERLQMDHKFVR
jgi:hypothetical protein